MAIRYAVIGTGIIANLHLKEFTARGVDVVGLCDLSESSLKSFSARFPQAVAVTDWREMLAKTKPDIVSICTPNKFHCEQAIMALEAGAHVACEKPMAMNVAEALRMEEVRKKAGKLGLVNFSYRNMSAFRFARKLIQEGELGRLLRVNAVYLQSHLGASDTPYAWRNDIEMAGFGALGDLGIHMIDAVRFITQQDYQRVIGVAQTLVPEKADHSGKMRAVTTDTNASFLAHFDNGMIGTFETTQVAPGYGNYFQIEISGEKGTIRVHSEHENEIWMTVGPSLTQYATWKTSLPLHTIPTGFVDQQWSRTPACLLDVLNIPNASYPSFQDGIIAQKVLGGILESMQTNAWVRV